MTLQPKLFLGEDGSMNQEQMLLTHLQLTKAANDASTGEKNFKFQNVVTHQEFDITTYTLQEAWNILNSTIPKKEQENWVVLLAYVFPITPDHSNN